MTYQQTLDFLYSQLPMFTRIGAAAYKKDLHNTIALLDHIGNPQNNFKSIHIAGTNGKGSTSHMLAAVFQNNGYKTGLYTSPHLKDFRERIKINGEWVDEQFVIDFTGRMKPIIHRIEPSFFELTVAMTFEYFSQQKVDIAIIETGLGGRLDSTNVVTPELSIITNIGWDHMNLLGNTLEEIAGEKAGIIKDDIPVIVGASNASTKPVFLAKAKEKNAPIFFADETIAINNCSLQIDSLSINYQKDNTSLTYTTDLPGLYQQYNLRNTLLAIDLLTKAGWQLDDAKNRDALQRVKSLTGLGGRWELVQRNPYLVLDVAHNEDGMLQVLEQVNALQFNHQNTSMVLGLAKDKDIEKVLSILPASFHYYFTNAHIPRAMPATELQQKAKEFDLQGEAFDDVNDAISTAIKNSSSEGLIIVCGSVFVVGEVEPSKFTSLTLPA